MKAEITPPVMEPSASSLGSFAYMSIPLTAPEMPDGRAPATKPPPLDVRRGTIV